MMRWWSQLLNAGRNAYRMIGDPTEGAMLVAAMKAWDGVGRAAACLPAPAMRSPLIQRLKRMTTVHEITWIKEEGPSPFHDQSKLGAHAITVKGAPDLVLRAVHRLPDDR